MRLLSNLDFTLIKYEQLCAAMASSNYTNVTFEEYFSRIDDKNKRFIILRHDIDENCKYALDIAKAEHRFKLKATYYFRMRKNVYVPAIVDKVAGYGHEIGYHYESVDKCNGNLEAALKLFESELSVLRQRYSVKTACMHGNPLSKYDNRTIWQIGNLSDFGLIGEPYLSLNYTKFTYFSDSGRTWNQSAGRKIKDTIDTSIQHNEAPSDTDELINIVSNGKPQNICVLTHPERWSKNLIDYSQRYLIDMAYTMGKTMIWMYRSHKGTKTF